MNTYTSSLRIGSTALVALVLLALAVVPSITRAADLGDYGYGDYYGDFGSSDYGYGDYYGSSDYGYGDYYSNDYSYPSYSDYGSYDYGSSYPYMPSSYSYVPYSIPSNSNTNVSSSVYAPQNTCTAPNSCNDNSVFNAPTVVTVTNNDTNTASHSSHNNRNSHNYNNNYSCTGCGCYNNCYTPVAYAAPYVSLSAAPYTGLDLGPVGTAVYWGFLALWALVMAYLIVVKRVQVTLFRTLNTFLFGEGEVAPAQVAFAGTPVTMVAPVVKKADGDDFILSQINRAR